MIRLSNPRDYSFFNSKKTILHHFIIDTPLLFWYVALVSMVIQRCSLETIMRILIYPNKVNFPFGSEFDTHKITSYNEYWNKYRLPPHFDSQLRKLGEHPLLHMFEALKELSFLGITAHVSLGQTPFTGAGHEDRYLKVPSNVAIMLTISDPEIPATNNNHYICLWRSPEGTKNPIELLGYAKDEDEITKDDWRNFFNQVIKSHLHAAQNKSATNLEAAKDKVKEAKKIMKARKLVHNQIYQIIKAQQKPQV